MTRTASCSYHASENSLQTIRAILDANAGTVPHRTAIQLGTKQLTYRQLRDAVAGVATHLEASGINPGVPVVLLFQNTLTSVVGFLALAWLNASVIPLGFEISFHELESIFEDIPFTAILGEGEKFIRFKESFCQPGCLFINLDTLVGKPPDSPGAIAPAAVSSDRAFVFHYTSGSTGKPKAALHSQSNLIEGGFIYQQTYRITSEDSILGAVPLHHSFGMIGGLVTALFCGSKLVLFERFIPHRVIKTLANEKITILLAVPFIYDLMTRCYSPDAPDLKTLRACLSSGAPLPPSTAKRFKNKYNQSIYQVYGSTETGIIAAQWPNDHDWPEGSVGCPLRGIQVRIVSDDGQILPPNEIGHLLVKTPAMFAGYFNQMDATDKAFRDGWYVTGDMARRDDRGYLYLVGRKDTFINVGGKKVNPLEVERVLLSHPLVKEAVVFGGNAGNAGEQVQAKIVGDNVSEAELLAFCRERLAFYKVPVQIKFLAELPKTGLGKVRRKE